MTILTKLLGISGETSDRLNEAAERLGEAAENVEIDEDKVETASEFLSSVADKLDNTWNASLGEAIKDALPWLADAGEVAGEVLPPVKLALKVVSRLAREADPRALGLLAFSLAYQAAVMDGVKAIENDPGATAGMAQRLSNRDWCAAWPNPNGSNRSRTSACQTAWSIVLFAARTRCSNSFATKSAGLRMPGSAFSRLSIRTFRIPSEESSRTEIPSRNSILSTATLTCTQR